MRKRIFSIFLAVAMIFCIIPLSAYADEHQHTFENKHGYDLSNLPEGYSIPCKIYESPCSSECGYSLYSWDVFGLSGQFVDKTGTSGLVVYQHYREWFEKIYGKNASAKQYETGGGSAGTGGAGRRPSGYLDDAGTPTYNSSGTLQMLVYPKYYSRIDGTTAFRDSFSYTTDSALITYSNYTYTVKNLTSKKISSYPIYFSDKYLDYVIDSPPIDGTYYTAGGVKYLSTPYTSAYYNDVGSRLSMTTSYSKKLSTSDSDVLVFRCKGSYSYDYGFVVDAYSTYSVKFLPLTVYIATSTEPVTKQTNITINQNTWNGNIYQDNSTNLTYIYPQYTTINENNETVTNISENPIIYNNETKEYYTYDSVTNNYYYITYVTETPTPTPSPDPTPTPDPGTDPTPTPEPGGDTGDTTGILAVLVEIRDNMIQGFADLKATLVQGWADLSANFTLAIENLNLNITNIFNKKFPDQSTPETAQPSPSPSPSPEPVDPILPDTQNYIIPKMNSNTFADGHGTWIASGSSKYSDVFDFFHAFDRSTSDFWETNVSPSYLQIEIPDPENYYIDGYIMRISKFNNRYAKDWTLQGSDDGNTWDDLDKQTGQNLSDMEEHKYSLTLRKAYKYYRVNMSNYASSMCSLSHFNLLGYDAEDVVTPTPSPSPTPDPGTDPTPAPTDKPSGGSTNNFWNFVFPGGNDDGTENGHKGILWALISLLIAVVTFVLGLGSAYSYVFPFLPAGLVTTIHICVLVLLLFAIIKFVRSFL